MDNNLINFLSELHNKALEIGASDATIIDAKIISIEDEIITYCRKPKCGSYAKSANCPPYSMKPAETRQMVAQYSNLVTRNAHRVIRNYSARDQQPMYKERGPG